MSEKGYIPLILISCLEESLRRHEFRSGKIHHNRGCDRCGMVKTHLYDVLVLKLVTVDT